MNNIKLTNVLIYTHNNTIHSPVNTFVQLFSSSSNDPWSSAAANRHSDPMANNNTALVGLYMSLSLRLWQSRSSIHHDNSVCVWAVQRSAYGGVAKGQETKAAAAVTIDAQDDDGKTIWAQSRKKMVGKLKKKIQIFEIETLCVLLSDDGGGGVNIRPVVLRQNNRERNRTARGWNETGNLNVK